MKIKIPNYILWKSDPKTGRPEPGVAIQSIRTLGSDKYRYKNAGRVRYNLMRTESELEDAFVAIEKLRMKMVNDAMASQSKEGGEAKALGGEHLQTYLKEFGQVLEMEDEHEIRPVKYSELDMDANNISNDVWGPLMGTAIEDDMEIKVVEKAA